MKRVMLAILTMVSLASHAEWTPLIEDREFGENHYIDLATVSDVDGAKQVTTLSDFPRDKKEACQGDGCAFLTSSRISVRHVECEAKRQRQIQFTDYEGRMGTGTVTQAAQGGPKKRYFRWYTPQPGSFFEVLINKVCAP